MCCLQCPAKDTENFARVLTTIADGQAVYDAALLSPKHEPKGSVFVNAASIPSYRAVRLP